MAVRGPAAFGISLAVSAQEVATPRFSHHQTQAISVARPFLSALFFVSSCLRGERLGVGVGRAAGAILPAFA
jgi:hypothetical protein